MRQRVVIAMALVMNPALVIADEPTTALDVTIQAQILELLRDLQRKFGTSILLITHDLGVVAETASRVIVMYGGEIVEEAPVGELFAHAHHPYTEGLLGAMPRVGQERERLATIPGHRAAADARGRTGCRFHDRCPYAWERCATEHPPLYQIGEQHVSRCHLAESRHVARSARTCRGDQVVTASPRRPPVDPSSVRRCCPSAASPSISRSRKACSARRPAPCAPWTTSRST